MKSLRNLKNEISENKLLFLLIILGVVVNITILFSSNDRILFITFLALIWYASETEKMKKEMIAQNELEQKPIVDLFYRPQTSNHEAYLRLRNNGKGVAYNINVEDVSTVDNEIFEFYFEDPNLILITGGEQTLEISAAYDKQGVKTWSGESLNYFLTQCVTKNTWENLDKDNELIINDKQKTKLIISYENGIGKRFRRMFFIYDQKAKTDSKKEFEVEFYKEKIL